MTGKSLGNLTRKEVSLIKAMLKLGKKHGFHVQRIQSYFSRPNRTVNPARFYEIRDGELGPDIASASETELHEFLYNMERQFGILEGSADLFPLLPTPVYIGTRKGRITVLSRDEIFVEEQVNRETRRRLLAAQVSIAEEFGETFEKSNVNPQLSGEFFDYAEIAANEEASVNIFLLNIRFSKLRYEIMEDREKIGDQELNLWKLFDQNHTALCGLYPEMQDYTAALAAARGSSVFPLDAAQATLAAIKVPSAQDLIDPTVPESIERDLDRVRREPGSQDEARYNAVATSGRVWSLLHAMTIIPNVQKNIEGVKYLKDEIWPYVKNLFDWIMN